jgi:cytochrome c-type biogenesis protein CcmH/NrfG
MLTVVLLSVVASATAPQQVDTLPAELRQARAALESGEVEQALDLARHYSSRNRRDPRGFILLGDAYSARLPAGRFRAIRAYRDAYRLTPDNPLPSYRIAELGFELGGADGENLAAEGLERVLALDPLYEDAWERWLVLYRNSSGRRDMIERLSPFGDSPRVKAMMARLLIEEHRYAEADSLLEVALALDPTNVEWLALQAQGTLESGDTAVGIRQYRLALENGHWDSTDALWKQIVGIATPAEVLEWERGVDPENKKTWIEAFWARRHPDLFAGVNHRIVEHFERWRHARDLYQLDHPLSLYERSEVYRGAQTTPSQREHDLYFRCEAMSEAGVAPIRDRIRVFPAPGSLGSGLQGPVYAPLGFDLQDADSVGARLGYNQETGLSDRGLLYLRFGAPDRMLVGADNVADGRCRRVLLDLERWYYAALGEIRFSRPAALHGPALNRMIFRPMNEPQYAATTVGITRDASSVPAPMEFGVWTAQFRSVSQARRTDIVVVSTQGALAATLVGPTSNNGEVRQAGAGVITLSELPGRYTLLAHARGDGQLGRQQLTITVRQLDARPALSDLLVTRSWPDPVLERRDMLDHVERTLTFAPGDTVRVYAEVYGLADDASLARYRTTYQLLRTEDVAVDHAKEWWPDALRFEFDRAVPRTMAPIPETLDLWPQWIPPGQYLLRVEVEDLVAGVPAGRATIAFEVRK